MPFKKLCLFILLVIGLSACAAPPVTQTPAPPSTPEPVAATLVTAPTPQPSATARFIPKQSDLLFVEFFAVT